MSADTETTGGPEGYAPCPKGCGRWTAQSGLIVGCWTCFGNPDQTVAGGPVSYPDWTPPIAAPAAHIERRKGQRWKFRNQHAAHFDATIVERKGLGWKVTDVVDHDGGGKRRAFSDVFWEEPNYYTMTLLADAPPEPAKCEPWCGNDLPPEGRPGWGFLLDDDADIAERFKLGRAGFVKRDLAIGWCTDECRESYISKTGFREMKSPPAQEAPPAAPACTNGSTCPMPTAPALERVLRDERQFMCDLCYLLSEERVSSGAGRGLAWSKLPTRLPRPQLAADWVEDCLTVSGR